MRLAPVSSTVSWIVGSPRDPTNSPTSIWTALGLATALAILGGSTLALVYADKSILAGNDSFGHMKIARFVVSGFQPGLAQLGGVWLPVQHLLMLPLIWNDWAFRSGIAGAIPSVLAFVATGMFVYFLTFRITHQRLAGLVALIVLASNPNILYMQSVPLQDIILFPFVVGGTYFLVKWAAEPERLGYLVLAGGMAFLASLTRVEGWGFAAAGIVVVAYVVARRRMGRGSVQAYSLSYGVLALYGIALWLLWGYLILGDALYLRHAEFSTDAMNNALRQFILHTDRTTPAKGSILIAVGDTLRAGTWNAGPVAAAIGAAGFLFWLFRERLKPSQLPVVLVAAPLAMLAFTMFTGDTFLLLPDRDNQTLNIRYGLVMVPAVAVYAGYLAKTHNLVKVAIVAAALAQGVWLIGGNNVVTHVDATRGLGGGGVLNLSEGGDQTSWQASQPTIQWFEHNYDSGSILIDSSSNNHIFFSSIPTNRFLHEGVYKTWNAALVDPAKYVDWIYMRPSETFKDRVWDALQNSGKLGGFVKVYELDGVNIYVSRAHYDEWMRSRQNPGG